MKVQIVTDPKTQLVREILETRSLELLAFLRALIPTPADAEDILQSGAMRAIEKAPELMEPEKAYSWILSILRNLALDFLRAHKRTLGNFEDIEQEALENFPQPELEEENPCQCGAELLGSIPQPYAKLLKDVEMEDAPIARVAQELGTTPNNISVRLHRARKALKHAVQDYCQVETLAQCRSCNCETKGAHAP